MAALIILWFVTMAFSSSIAIACTTPITAYPQKAEKGNKPGRGYIAATNIKAVPAQKRCCLEILTHLTKMLGLYGRRGCTSCTMEKHHYNLYSCTNVCSGEFVYRVGTAQVTWLCVRVVGSAEQTETALGVLFSCLVSISPV